MSVTTNNKTESSSIYCVKAFGAFCVICIHCNLSPLLFPIIRTAVPIFFMISGYFLYNGNNEEAIRHSILTLKKITWLTVYANIFYYICFCCPDDLLPINGVADLLSLIFGGGKIGYHLWYLNTLIFTLLTIVLFLKIRKIHILWMAIPLLVSFGLITGKYNFLFSSLPNALFISRNFITMGIPCFGIGWLLRKYEKRITTFKYPVLLLSVITGFSIAETTFLINHNWVNGDYIITTIPLAAAILLVSIIYPNMGNGIIRHIGKYLATGIYVFHIFILYIVENINNDYLHFSAYMIPILTFIFSAAFVLIWSKASEAACIKK